MSYLVEITSNGSPVERLRYETLPDVQKDIGRVYAKHMLGIGYAIEPKRMVLRESAGGREYSISTITITMIDRKIYKVIDQYGNEFFEFSVSL